MFLFLHCVAVACRHPWCCRCHVVCHRWCVISSFLCSNNRGAAKGLGFLSAWFGGAASSVKLRQSEANIRGDITGCPDCRWREASSGLLPETARRFCLLCMCNRLSPYCNSSASVLDTHIRFSPTWSLARSVWLTGRRSFRRVLESGGLVCAFVEADLAKMFDRLTEREDRSTLHLIPGYRA